MQEMLYFIYTGTSTNLPAMADELLAAADKVHIYLCTCIVYSPGSDLEFDGYLNSRLHCYP